MKVTSSFPWLFFWLLLPGLGAGIIFSGLPDDGRDTRVSVWTCVCSALFGLYVCWQHPYCYASLSSLGIDLSATPWTMIMASALWLLGGLACWLQPQGGFGLLALSFLSLLLLSHHWVGLFLVMEGFFLLWISHVRRHFGRKVLWRYHGLWITFSLIFLWQVYAAVETLDLTPVAAHHHFRYLMVLLPLFNMALLFQSLSLLHGQDKKPLELSYPFWHFAGGLGVWVCASWVLRGYHVYGVKGDQIVALVAMIILCLWRFWRDTNKHFLNTWLLGSVLLSWAVMFLADPGKMHERAIIEPMIIMIFTGSSLVAMTCQSLYGGHPWAAVSGPWPLCSILVSICHIFYLGFFVFAWPMAWFMLAMGGYLAWRCYNQWPKGGKGPARILWWLLLGWNGLMWAAEWYGGWYFYGGH